MWWSRVSTFISYVAMASRYLICRPIILYIARMNANMYLFVFSLNFPWANRCISLDLWWNHAVEQQAFGRIFRIGQKKETHMTRIVVRNSVDMRMLNMQLSKLQNLEKVCFYARTFDLEKSL